MEKDINEILKKLESAQNLLHKGKNSDASTVVYEAECMLIFLRDHGLTD